MFAMMVAHYLRLRVDAENDFLSVHHIAISYSRRLGSHKQHFAWLQYFLLYSRL